MSGQTEAEVEADGIRVIALGGGEGSWRGSAAVGGLVAGIARHYSVRCVVRCALCVVGFFFCAPSHRAVEKDQKAEEGCVDGARCGQASRDAMRCDAM